MSLQISAITNPSANRAPKLIFSLFLCSPCCTARRDPAFATVHSLCVVSRKSDTGSKGYPFLGSARGAREAEDLLTQSEFVGGERAGKQEKHTAIYPGSGRPKANSPTPACLDRCHHDGELQVVFLGEVPRRVAARGRRRADPALGRSPLSPTSSPRLKLSAWRALPVFLLVPCL